MNEDFSKIKAKAKGPSEYIDDETLSVDFIRLDLASLKSVMEFIEAFKSTGKALHSLICNAGIFMGSLGNLIFINVISISVTLREIYL